MTDATPQLIIDFEEFAARQSDAWIIAYLDIFLQLHLYDEIFDVHNDYFTQFRVESDYRVFSKGEHSGIG